LAEEQVEIYLEEANLVIQSGSSSTKIKGMPTEDYPVMPDLDEKHPFVVTAPELRRGLESSMIAAARNEIRPELAGVYFGFNTSRYKGLVLAATDSYRLSEIKLPLTQGDDTIQVIVPLRAVLEIDRVLNSYKNTGGENNVRLWVGENQIALRFEDFEMTSRLVDGKYPDYTVIIPNSFKTTATLPVDAVKNKIKAAGLFTTTGTNAVLFDLKAGNQNLSISSMSSQTGEHTSIVDGVVRGEENSILLNHRYVLDGLQYIQGDLDFNVNGQDSPCLLKQTGKDDFLYIVMPIRK
jgi:DNA polymerase-3 subunit beta